MRWSNSSDVATATRPRCFNSVATRLSMSASMTSNNGSAKRYAALSYVRTARHHSRASAI
jgi:ureidoglycolate hydrolase